MIGCLADQVRYATWLVEIYPTKYHCASSDWLSSSMVRFHATWLVESYPTNSTGHLLIGSPKTRLDSTPPDWWKFIIPVTLVCMACWAFKMSTRSKTTNFNPVITSLSYIEDGFIQKTRQRSSQLFEGQNLTVTCRASYFAQAWKIWRIILFFISS